MGGWVGSVYVCVGVSAGVELEPRSLCVHEKWAERQAKHCILRIEGGGTGKAKMFQRKYTCVSESRSLRLLPLELMCGFCLLHTIFRPVLPLSLPLLLPPLLYHEIGIPAPRADVKQGGAQAAAWVR